MGSFAPPSGMPSEADTIMGHVLEHYIKHYDAVMRKLTHAKNATHRSLEEISQDREAGDGELSEIKAYDGMWDKIIRLYKGAGVCEDDLFRIEKILVGMPKLIMKHYDNLIKKDEELQQLLKQLDSEVYKKAIEHTRKVQAKPDKMSGLSPSEYDVLPSHKNALIFKIHNSRR